MRFLVRMLIFIIDHFDVLEKNTDSMTKEEYESFKRMRDEFNKVPREKLDEIKKELNSITRSE